MTAVALAYEHCRRVARDSGSSFYAGMRLLPAERRNALFAVYALARRIDDVADDDGAQGDKLAALTEIRTGLERLDEGVDPVLVALADASARFPIPVGAFGELVDGAEMDVRGTEYATYAELERYCRCVAGSIGRLSLGVFDCSDRVSAAPLADELGIALQIGNILRDVGEDAARGRVYLPREDLERFGCAATPAALQGPIELVPLIDRRSGSCVLAMAGKYRRLLERIAAEPSLVLRGRLSLRPWEKGLVLARSLTGTVA